MVGERIGGVNVFGGGPALYDSSHAIVGGVGVSGDTSCADHHIAYRTRVSSFQSPIPGFRLRLEPEATNQQGHWELDDWKLAPIEVVTGRPRPASAVQEGRRGILRSVLPDLPESTGSGSRRSA